MSQCPRGVGVSWEGEECREGETVTGCGQARRVP